MREIKFRAWDKNAEIMVYSDQEYDDFFFEFKDGKLKAFRVVICPGTLHEPPYPSSEELDNLTEYTGLKDKNGKEIYEGDIIKYTRKNWHCFGHPEHKKDLIRICTIYWNDEKHAFGSDSKFSSGYLSFNDERADENILEIIGNIYENPELFDKPPETKGGEG